MAKPKVSVCIPCYNNARYLPQAIESVLGQNYNDFELLIIDDCSADGSREVIAEYAARDSRIVFLRNERNLGMVGNWNRCIREARGEYIKYVFGDDLLCSSDALARMAALLEGDRDIAMVAASRYYIDQDSRIAHKMSYLPSDLVVEGTTIISYTLFENKNIIGEPTVVMFRKDKAGRGFDPRYRQIVDLEMWFHLMEQGKFAFIKDYLCSFRMHQEQQTLKNLRDLAHIDDYVMLCNDYLGKDYIAFGPLGKWHVLYYQFYYLWKLARRGYYDREVAQEKIAGLYGTCRFYFSLPLYKAYNPIFKFFIRRLMRPRLLQTYGHYGQSK